MSEYETITYVVDDGLLTITLNRPDRLNAFNLTMLNELLDAFDRSDADDDVRVVIVTGAGRGFCSGADIAGGGDTFSRRTGASDNEPLRDGGGRASLRIFESLKPVIGAINGAAVGVGMTMTLPMDIRLASESARFGCVFVRRGIVPEAASTWFLPRLVGPSRAAEWVLTGRLFDATEALEAGLVRSVHPAEELLAVATSIGREIADNTSAVSVAVARRMLLQGLMNDRPYASHIAESRAMGILGRSADAVEGVDSFLEKRRAVFPGRVSIDLPDVWSPPQPSWAADLPAWGETNDR
ncbi:MAG: crotonase/enoyl-CoA hydratase family protein [bacterium]|nr:crotonase/enoyl-CoA hydratase family protein [bacterium]